MAIKIEGVSKRFATADSPAGVKVALDNVSLSLPQGTVCGLLGPNGAGKTTLLRIINNILVADSGSVRIMGKPVSLAETSPLTGYMPEERGLYDNMRVEDQILYFGMLKGGDRKALRKTMDEYLALFNLLGDKRRKIKELSKGNQQKVQIISTIVHEPDIVMLDEPFSGFDPINGALLRQLIDRLHDRGTTVILSSHNMESIEKMCSRIALINHGNLLLDGNLDDIKEAHRDGTLLLTTRNQLHIPLLADSGTVSKIEPYADSSKRGHTYKIALAENATNSQLLTAVATQAEILSFTEQLPSLADIFILYASTDASSDISSDASSGSAAD